MHSEDNVHRTPESACPTCGHKLDAVSNMSGDAGPGPGDASICIGCGELLEFADDMTLIKMSEELRNDLDPRQLKQLLFFQDRLRGKYSVIH